MTEDTKGKRAELLALQGADAALREYACHGGPSVPCLRTGQQCAENCGKAAADALLLVEACLKARAAMEQDQ